MRGIRAKNSQRTFRGPRGGLFHISASGRRVSGPAPAGEVPKKSVFSVYHPDLNKEVLRSAFTPKGYSGAATEINHAKQYDGGIRTTVVFKLKHKSGKYGSIEREFEKSSNGSISVHHSLFEIPKELNGKGSAKEVMAKSFALYEKIGVKKVTMHAVDVGKYVWAALGFKASEPSERKKVVTAFSKFLVKKRIVADVKNFDLPQIANMVVKGVKIGKKFLLSDDCPSWGGVLAVDKKDPYYKMAVKKVTGK